MACCWPSAWAAVESVDVFPTAVAFAGTVVLLAAGVAESAFTSGWGLSVAGTASGGPCD